MHCNHELSDYIQTLIGTGFLHDAEELEKLLAYQDDEEVLKKLKEIKKAVKA